MEREMEEEEEEEEEEKVGGEEMVLMVVLGMLCCLPNTTASNIHHHHHRHHTATTTITTAATSEHEFDNYVSYSELVSDTDRFTIPGVTSFTQLLFDPTNYQVIVGARDHIYRLSLVGLQQLEEAKWASNGSTVEVCKMKGQSAANCHNYVRVLHRYGDRVLVCGTNSFSPLCTWRNLSNIGHIESSEKGVAHCPFDPRHSITSLVTPDGSLYVGTFTDFTGNHPRFMRMLGNNRSLWTKQWETKWLSAPTFVASFLDAGFVYVAFTENAEEALSCGKRVYSRLARVCRNDRGTAQNNHWTTFLKARLSCSRPGPHPFHYNYVQALVHLPQEQLIYGVFSTAANSIAGSAVCAFNMTAVNMTFEGPFKVHSSTWGPVTDDNSQFQCQNSKSTHDAELMANKYQMMDKPIASQGHSPLFTIDDVRLSHIAVDIISTRQSGMVHVIFVAERSGKVRKLSVPSQSGAANPCLLEELSPFPDNSSVTIHSMKLLRDTNSLYLGTSEGVVRLPVHRCGRHKTQRSCLSARDPYCGWDTNRLQCSPPPGKNPLVTSWLQEVMECPVSTDPVDGEWSGWSHWSSCQQSGSGDSCQCRQRACDSPAPRRGGTHCTGPHIEVTNCTVHGGWTAWSSWSQCSANCGIAVKTRRRTCSNPAPKHGGRVCVGQERTEIYCHSLPRCPSYTALPVDGGWSEWGAWGTCSASCGGAGVRQRRRTCTHPSPKNGGSDCAGCGEETESCGKWSCPETRQLSSWSQWVGINVTGEYVTQRRFRAECVATGNAKDPLRTGDLQQEDRVCPKEGWCGGEVRAVVASSPWSEWSKCSVQCGGGRQWRSRRCGADGCGGGEAVQERGCNEHPCPGLWACWREWSSCSSSCGSGKQVRTRRCVSSHNPFIDASDCSGPTTSYQPCHGHPCPGEEGWGMWSLWSECGGGGSEERVRIRHCLSDDPSQCRGLDLQREACAPLMDNAPVLELLDNNNQNNNNNNNNNNTVTVTTLVWSCLACLAVGALVGSLTTYHLFIRRYRHRRVPSSPHYITAKPNHYVSVPAGERRAGTSPGGSLKSAGGLRAAIAATLPLKEFDTATIKRSSHGNGHLRADLDSDTIFNF
ncbi:semaphorin-5B-like isoform X2 [Scylla paramamosain]|uniref:semaphorin-5B-like isoform X2 n=1 Tax=Scylla paramamosain TaxID=85552 RepID=UPI003082A87D